MYDSNFAAEMESNLNIYSEPMFPSTQFPSSSSSVSSLTSTQSQKSRGVIGGDEIVTQSKDDQTEVRPGTFEQEDEAVEEEPFSLDQIVCRAIDLKQTYLSTGCDTLDKSLKGGIPTFGLTEFYGESGVGKTQMCLQLAITAQLPNKSGSPKTEGVLYICTEDAFPVRRLGDLTRSFKERFPELPDNVMDNIFIEHVADSESLMVCVNLKLETLARSKKVRLVILDSIAGIFRSEFEDIRRRSKEMRQVAQVLHEYSCDYDAAIVACNQISAIPNGEGGNVAALGMVWKTLVANRIHMYRLDPNSGRRAMHVDFSAHIPSNIIPYWICAGGIQGTLPSS